MPGFLSTTNSQSLLNYQTHVHPVGDAAQLSHPLSSSNQKKKKPVRVNKFSKAVGIKINIQKSIAFLYTNKELHKKEIKKSITLTITPKKINSEEQI